MRKLNKLQNGFSAFVVLVVVVLLAIAGVVGFVVLKGPSVLPAPQMPSAYVAVSSSPQAQGTTPVPTVSASTDYKVMQKELDDTKVDSPESEFDSLNTSASSL